MCQQEFQAEVMDEERQLDEEGQPVDLGEMVFQLGCYLNRAYVAEMQADLPPHKRGNYLERFYEIADMQRKARRENAA